MQDNLITAAQSAYAYPLLVKQLLINSVSLYGDQEISYRGQMRYTFRDFRGRIGQLASALTALGAGHGTTVAVMDWDSHRYLECYFGVPMMGATLFTVNVRLSPQQILYTLNDAGADVVLFHADFAPVLEQIRGELTCNPRFVLMADGQDAPALTLPLAGSMRRCSTTRRPTSSSGTSTRTPRPRPSTPPAPPAIPRASATATARSCCTRWHRQPACVRRARASACIVKTSICRSRRCSTCWHGASRTLP